jgi:hypothetical protein
MTNETSPMKPHTGNATSLRWQELGRRKGAEEVGRDMGLLVASLSLLFVRECEIN